MPELDQPLMVVVLVMIARAAVPADEAGCCMVMTTADWRMTQYFRGCGTARRIHWVTQS